jgi:gametolysin peptidase M11
MLRRPAVIAVSMLAGVLLAPAAAQAHTGDAVTMEGTLEFRHSDDFQSDSARYYYALRQGNRRVRLDFGHWRTDLRNGARLRVRGTLARGRLSVDHLRRLHRAPTRALAATGPGPRKVAVLLFNFSNDASQPYTPAQAATTMFTAPASVSSYFQEESFGATSLNGDVFGWFSLPTSNSGCAVDVWAQAANAAATASGVNLTNYQHIVYAFPFASSCGWAGLAEMPGSHVWINGSFNLRVLGHELSHNLGVHHAASLSCTSGVVRVSIGGTCSYSEYGDPFDIMGSSSRHSSSWHKGQIGWLDPLAKQTVTASGTYTISPQEWAAGGVQALRIARGTSGNYLYLEYRRPYGSSFDTFSLSDPVVNGVTIRMAPDYGARQLSYLVDTTTTTSTFTDAALAAGQTFADSAYNISIRTTSVSATGATVQISLDGSTPPPPPPADTTAPGAPGTLGGQLLAGPAVGLSWGAATDNLGVTGYRVYRAGVELGTTVSTAYSDTAAPAGSTVAYTVRAYDAAANLGPLSNAFTVTIPSPPPPPPPPGDTPPTNRTVPTIAGTTQQGSTLTASPGAWNGTTPMTFTFRWVRCERTGVCREILGATASTFRLTARDVGRTVRVVVAASNSKGSATATSAATATVRRYGVPSIRTRDGWDSAWAATMSAEQARFWAYKR